MKRQASTGPRSRIGKKRSSQNAIAHGVLSLSPTLPGENQKPWQMFRDVIYRDIGPVGAVEESLTGMLALQIWRYRRLALFENAVMSQRFSEMDLGNSKLLKAKQNLEKEISDCEVKLASCRADRQLFALVDQDDHISVTADEAYNFYERFGHLFDIYTVDPHDNQLLAYVGATPDMPEKLLDEYDLTDWKVAHLKKGAEYIANLAQHSAATAIGRAREEVENRIRKINSQLLQLRRKCATFEAENQEMLERAYALHGMPEEEQMQRINRYSTSLQRQLLSTLHELQRLQAGRTNGTTTLPLAIDVTVNADAINQVSDNLIAHAQPFGLQRHSKQIETLQPLGS